MKSKKYLKLKRGFTLVELMISVVIFVMMTSLLIAKYGNFNQNVLLTNLAYDIALTIKTAQTYGLSVQNQSLTTGGVTSPIFRYSYGVSFCNIPEASNGCGFGSAHNLTNDQKIVLFADSGGQANGYDQYDIPIQTYTLKKGAKVYGFCTGAGTTQTCSTIDTKKRLDIAFTRPNPDAFICMPNNTAGAAGLCTGNQILNFIKIFIKASDGTIRTIMVRKTGQISVEN